MLTPSAAWLLYPQEVAQQRIVTKLRVLFEEKAAKEDEFKRLDARQQSIRTERSHRGDRKDYSQLLTATGKRLAEVIGEIKTVTEQIVQLETEYSRLGDKMECK